VLVVLLAVWVLVFIRLAYVQLWRWKYYDRAALAQHTDSLQLAPERGRLFDRLGRPLTLNDAFYVLDVWPQKLATKDSLAGVLARAGLGTRAVVRAELERHRERFTYPVELGEFQADSLWRSIVRARFGKCTEVRSECRRVYPFGASTAGVVGFCGKDGGLAGLESWYDSVLSGRPGWALMQREGSGLCVPYPGYPRVEPVPGASIRLTLDADVQEICFRALAAGVERTRAKSGSAVVLDAKSGAILALANWPSFEPDRFRDFEKPLYRCKPLCDEFEPGSSFKVVVAATALESPNRDALLGRTYDVSAGYIEVAGYKIGDAHNHGILDFDGLLVMSSNPGCALLSFELDRNLYYRIGQGLGFGRGLGIGYPGEAGGRLDKPANLNRLRLANIAFGQGVTVNLVQLTAAYLCVANNGTYVKPYLVSAVQCGGVDWQRPARTETRQVLARGTTERLKDILRKVVTEGTGTPAAIPGIDACGKTGTAQKVEPWGKYSDTRSLMSFVGFFPKDRPKYVVGVVVDEPGTERFASTSAGPVFAEIGQRLLLLDQMRERESLIADHRRLQNASSAIQNPKSKIQNPALAVTR